MSTTPPPTVGALFAGYGGIELALHDVLGAEPAWFSEFDTAPSKILAHRYPGVPNHGDVTRIDWAAVEPVDIITGGSPCQDLSHAGKRAGMKAGTRSGLWASMCDAVDIIRPSLVLWENVRGALSAEADSAVERCGFCVDDGPGPSLRALGRVVGDLAELGYVGGWVGLRAADVGAPHGRFRIFVLAWPATNTQSGRRGTPGHPHHQAWSVDAPVSGAHQPGRPPAWGSREWRDLTLMPTPVTQPTTGNGHARNLSAEVLLPTPVVNDMGKAYTPETWDEWTAKLKASHGNGNGHGASLSIEAMRLMPSPRASDGEKGGPNQRGSSGDLMLPSAVQPANWGVYGPAVARWERVFGRPAPAPTEPTGKNGAHRLSPRFVEWMQGLRDGWVTDPAIGITRNDQLKALGNGVVPQQCAAAVRHLLTIRAATLEAAA